MEKEFRLVWSFMGFMKKGHFEQLLSETDSELQYCIILKM